MEELKYELPKISSLSYKILIYALKFYRVSNVEFALDGELVARTYEVLDYIEMCSSKIEKDKYKLPKFNFSSYEIIINALRYYWISSVEFSEDKEIISQIYKMINYIEKNINIVPI